jgi:hypothetical protein
MVMLAAVSLLLGLLSLPGADQPTCQPVEPGQPVCLTALDCEGEVHPSCSGAWRCLEAACSWECAVIDPGCYSDQDCKEGEHCTASTECLPPPDCPMCTVCWGHCVADTPDPCGAEPGVGACGDGLSCQCRPPADCPMCSSCSYGCYPTDDRCRFEADCWFGSTCDFEGTPDYCAMIMAPVLPPACWGTCRTCDGICPAVMCPGGQYMDPCTCKCLPY